jgi:TRAP-type C4-dicarboxylate transport system substrate-binding protein
MRIARRALLMVAGAAVAAPSLARLAKGQAQVTLKLHHFFSPSSSTHARILAPWARKIGIASEGRIRVEVHAAMSLGGTPSDLYDQARDGIADIVWALPGISPGRFPIAEAFELPFVAGRRALVNARAAQEFADTNLKDELRAVVPLCVVAHDQCLLHTNRAVVRLDDLKDLKLRPPTRLAGEALKALGASAAFIPLSHVGEAFGRNALDGCVLPWDTAAAAKVHELMGFHAAFAASPTLSTTPYILAMNRAKYAALPPDLKTVIDDNAADAAAIMIGRAWDEQAAGIADMVRQRGNTLSEIAADESARWRKATEPVVEAWIGRMRQRSIDGGAAVETIRTLVAKYEEMPAPPAAPSLPDDPPTPPPPTTAVAPAAPVCTGWCPSP